jgi:hypothetical protein
MSFHVGQKVECVRDLRDSFFDDHPARWPDHIRQGCVYTVRGFFLMGAIPALYLEEYVAPVSFAGHELAFEAENFRPIVEKKTDISIFTSLLNPSLEEVLAVKDREWALEREFNESIQY